MERFLKDDECNPKQLSPLTLAFIGDTVYDLFVREMLICQANRPANKLHREAVKRVRAKAQAQAVELILPLLTDEEKDILKRGRNAHTNHLPKNASESDYHYATGFEALLGYIYLKGDIERLRTIFSYIRENTVIE
ncbi:MAG: ribonuclease III [Clostridiales bacterium]|nr:ribonuclease III [Clostridiales bacterium]